MSDGKKKKVVVTDPALLAQLNSEETTTDVAPPPHKREAVTDPALLQQLNAPTNDISDNNIVPRETSVEPNVPQQPAAVEQTSPTPLAPPQPAPLNVNQSMDFMHYALGDNYEKYIKEPKHTEAQATISTERKAADDFIKNDAANFLNQLPPGMKEIYRSKGYDLDKIAQGITSPIGGEKELTEYYKARKEIFDRDYEYKRQQILAQKPTGQESDAEFDRKVKKVETDLKLLDEENRTQRSAFENSAFQVAANKVMSTQLDQYGFNNPETPIQQKRAAVNAMRPEEIGSKVLNMLGENTSDIIGKDGGLDQTQRAQRQQIGYQALQMAAYDAYAKGDMELASFLKKKTDNYQQKVLDQNPQYRKMVFGNAISKEMDKRANTFTNFFLGTSADKAYIDQLGKEMGMRPQDYADITPDDIVTAPSAITKLAGGLLKPVVQIDASLLRAYDNITGEKGADDFTKYWNNSGVGRTFGWNRDETNSMGFREQGTKLDTNPQSPTYGQEIANEKAGKYRLGWNTIGSEVVEGIAQLIPMAAGAKTIGTGLQAANLISNANTAQRVGLGLYNYITYYDDNYKQATQAVGTNPDDEGTRVGLANIYSLVTALASQIMPDTKIADKWIGTSAGKELIDLVKKKGIDNVTAEMAKPLIVRAIKEGGGDFVKEVSEEVIEQVGQIAANKALAPKAYAQTDVGDELTETAIVAAIQSFIPTMGGGIAHAKSAGPMYKNALFEIGSNPQVFVEDINKKIAAGEMDQATGAERIRAINSIAEVYKTVPTTSFTNGEHLTPEQQKDYGVNLIAEKQLEAQKEGMDDKVQTQAIEQYIKALQSQRGDILAEAGFQPSRDENIISVNDVVGKKILYKGEPATVYVDEANRVIVVDDATGREYDNVGNINMVGRQPIAGFDMEEVVGPASVVSVSKNGNFDIRGKEYMLPVEHADNPLAAINYHNEPGKKGVPTSVTLTQRSANGGTKKVTFRGSVAEDLMYQLHLQKLNKDDSYGDLQEFINTDKETRDAINTGRPLQAAEEETVADNAEVPAVEGQNEINNQPPDLFSSPLNTNSDGKDSATPRQGANQTVNGSDQSRITGRNEQNQVQDGSGSKNGNEKQQVLNPPSLTSAVSGTQTTANPFGFVSEDLFNQPPAPEVKPVANTPAPAAPVQQQTQEQIKLDADQFFNKPQSETEVAESAKVGDKIRERFNKADKILGRKNTRVLNDGSEVTGRYVLIDANAITPSHNPKTFGTTEGFPMLESGRNPNDRDYTKKANKDRVILRSQSYDGRAAEKVPTVDKNGVVIDGNDRTMSGQLAAGMGTDKKYIATLKAKADTFGFTPAQIDAMIAQKKHPRVVMVIDEVQPYNTKTFSNFNPKTEGKVKTPIEEAIEFGRTIDNGIIDRIGQVMNGFDSMAHFFSNKAATKQVRDVMERAGILNPDNVTGYYRDGKFTTAGKELLQNVMLGKVFNEETLHLLEASPGVREKVIYSMSNIMSIEALGDEYSLQQHMSDALHLKDRVDETLLTNGISLKEKEAGLKILLAQGDMFGAKEFSDEAIAMWQLLEDPTKVAFRDFTKEYLKNAKNYSQNSGADMFGQVNPTREQLIDNYLKKLEEYERSKASAVPPKEANAPEPTVPIAEQPGQNILGSQQDGPAGNASPDQAAATESTEDAVAVPPASKVFEEPAPVAMPLDKAEAIEAYNNLKNLTIKKERKVELLEEERERVVKGEHTSETGAQLNDIDARLERERAALRSLKNKGRQAEAAIGTAKTKSLADQIRSAKIEEKPGSSEPQLKATSGGELFMDYKASLFNDEVIKKIGVKLYNASLEIAARAVEAGHDIKVAIQKAVDYIHERHFTSWGEKQFRDNLGDQLNDVTAESLRAKKLSEAPLSEANRNAADALIESVKADANSLQSAIKHIDDLPIDATTKDRLKNYIRTRIVEEFHKAPGEALAAKHLQSAGGDFDAALQSMGSEFDNNMLNTTTNEQKENLRSQYAAAKSMLESQRTAERVKNGQITPKYKPDELTGDVRFEMPAYEKNKEGNLTGRGRAKKIKDKTATNMQDRYSPLEAAQRNSRVPITPDVDAVTAMRLKKSKAWNKIHELRNFLGNTEHVKGSMFDRMKKDGVDLSKLGLYLYAKHAEERNGYNARMRQKAFDGRVYELNQQIAESTNPDKQKRLQAELQDVLDQKDSRFALMPDGGSGMTNAQAQEILAEVDADPLKDKYEAYAKEFKEKVVDKILDEKHESYQISDEDYDHLKNFYQNYVPLKVKDEVILAENDGEEDNKFFSNSAINGRELYRSKGAIDRTVMDRNNPVLQGALDLEHSYVKGEENKANNVLANFVKANANENVWEIKPAQYETIKDDKGNIVKAWENEDTRPKNAIPFYDHGKKSYIILRDERLVQMNKQLGSNLFIKMGGAVSRWIATVNTLKNPAFFIKNLFFDQQDAYMSLLGSDNPELAKRFKSYNRAKALRDIIANKKDSTWGKWVEDWKKQGGAITFQSQITNEKHAKQSSEIFKNYDKTLTKSQAKHLLSKLNDFATSLEVGTRVMAYRAAVEGEAAKIAKEKGITEEEAMKEVNKEKAAVISRNATVDFEKKGVYGAYIGAWKAFANAGIQGASNIMYLAAKSPRVRKFLGAMVMAGIAEAEIARLFSKCDPPTPDCYLDQSEFDKERSFMIPLAAFGGHGYAKIPVGRNFGWFNYIGKKMDEFAHGEIKPSEFFATTLGSMMDYYDFTGGTAPVEQKIAGNAAPIVQLSTNKTFYGAPVSPEAHTGQFDSEAYFPKTPEAFVKASEFLRDNTGGSANKEGKIDVSPNTLELITQSIFGGLGNFTVNPGEAMAKNYYSPGNLSRLKKEYRDIAEKSEKELLTKEDIALLERDLKALEENGDITKAIANKRVEFIKRNQSAVRKKIGGRVKEGQEITNDEEEAEPKKTEEPDES